MFVYNDITIDARVQRAANALAGSFELSLISIQTGKRIDDKKYKNIFVGGQFKGAKNLFHSIGAALRIIHKHHPAIVYCHDYYSAILAYILLLFRFPGKIVYDAHELIIPEEGNADKRQKLFYWFEKRIVKKVSLVVCASEQRSNLMQKHYGLKSLPLVVPNISQLEINDKDEETVSILTSLDGFFRNKAITIVYAGVVTISRRIDELFDVVMALADRFKLLIVGDGDALLMLKDKSANHPELSVAFTGRIPYKCLGSILSRCDIGFLYYPNDTLNNIYCASNKIYEYASVGLPMLANDNPTVKGILEEALIGISTRDIKRGLCRLADCRETYKANCDSFVKDNQWKDVAEVLNQHVLNLFR